MADLGQFLTALRLYQIQNLQLKQKKKGMGAIKSITHSYTSNQYLFWYIEKNDVPKIEELLAKKPSLVNENLSVNYKTTPLHRAASNGNLALVQLLVEKYQANIDLQTSAGETALIGATKRSRLQVVEYLLRKGCNSEVYSSCGFTALDYAILQGLYEVALILYDASPSKAIKDAHSYQEIGKKYKYRYVNYNAFLESLTKRINPDNTPNFLVKSYKKFEDPVVDPRQSWKEWFVRNMDFKDPPLVERSELPEELQPQNKKFAAFRHTLTQLTLSRLSQSTSLHPLAQSENISDCKFHEQESIQTEPIHIKSSS